VNPFLAALIYGVSGILIVPMIFAIFKTKHSFPDIALAAAGAALVSLVPVIGGTASFAAMVLILYWRLRENLAPDILVAAGVSRLAALPLMMLLH